VTSARRLARLALVAVIAASAPALLGAPIGGTSLATPLCVNAGAQNHAAIVVEHSNGTFRTTCVGFDATSLTGKQLLDASQIPYGVSTDPNYGDAVCSVDGEPQTYPPNCLSALPNYWALTHASYGSPWMVANRGIDGLVFVDGDAMGLRYVPQSSQPQAPARSPAGLCPPPQPKPTPSQTPSNVPAPSAGAMTPLGSATIANPSPAGAAPSPVPSATIETSNGIGSEPTPTALSRASPNRGTPTAARPERFKPSNGWIATAVAAAVLIGMLAVQVLAGRRRG
jgi:hypothetical protein